MIYKIFGLAAALALVAPSAFGGGPTIVQPKTVVSPVALDDKGTQIGSFGGDLPWLIEAAAVVALIVAADDSSSDIDTRR